MKLIRMRWGPEASRAWNLFSISINKFRNFFMIASYQNIPKQMVVQRSSPKFFQNHLNINAKAQKKLRKLQLCFWLILQQHANGILKDGLRLIFIFFLWYSFKGFLLHQSFESFSRSFCGFFFIEKKREKINKIYLTSRFASLGFFCGFKRFPK